MFQTTNQLIVAPLQLLNCDRGRADLAATLVMCVRVATLVATQPVTFEASVALPPW